MNSTGKTFLIGLTTALIVVASGIAWCQDTKPATMPTTIEVHNTWDLLPGIDKNAYAEWVKNFIATILKQPGLIEFRAYRNVAGSPQARNTFVWQSLSDWAKFAQSKEWAEIDAKFRTFATNWRMEIWGIAPLVPKPLRPGQ
jgi:heme-degrading monooxygenase HmoA